MYEQIANAFVIALEGYVLLGAIFAIVFVSVGVNRIDPTARGAGIAFRLLISRWIGSVHEPPLERNPHR
jgi:hypothetical protein